MLGAKFELVKEILKTGSCCQNPNQWQSTITNPLQKKPRTVVLKAKICIKTNMLKKMQIGKTEPIKKRMIKRLKEKRGGAGGREIDT